MQLKGIYNICQEIDIQKEGSKTNFVGSTSNRTDESNIEIKQP